PRRGRGRARSPRRGARASRPGRRRAGRPARSRSRRGRSWASWGSCPAPSGSGGEGERAPRPGGEVPQRAGLEGPGALPGAPELAGDGVEGRRLGAVDAVAELEDAAAAGVEAREGLAKGVALGGLGEADGRVGRAVVTDQLAELGVLPGGGRE